MPRGSGGNVAGFKLLSTPNAPTGLSVSTSIGSATVSFTAPTDTGDGAITSYVVTAVDESTGASTGGTGSASPITVSPPAGGTFKIRAQAINAFGPGRLTEFDTGNVIYSGAELYAFGRNANHGQLGDGTRINKSSPVQIGSNSWTAIETGVSASIAIRSTGNLYAWGYNSFGQIGNNSTVSRSSPVLIGALTNWAKVSSGQSFSAAVKTDNTLWTWGVNQSNGELGLGTSGLYTNKSSPTQVGSLSDWYQVSCGRGHVLSVKTDGTLWTWGNNSKGQLGHNDLTSRSTPAQVGSLSNWAQVSSGVYHSTAVKTDGTLWTWGMNNYGQLGIGVSGSFQFRSSPVQVGALQNWSYVAAGTYHNIAVKTDGTIWTWGTNNNGQLGDGTVANKSSPVQIGALTTWLKVTAGYASLAIKTDGTLWSWGLNNFGQLGDGTVANKSSPVQIGSSSNWEAVSNHLATHTLSVQNVL